MTKRAPSLLPETVSETGENAVITKGQKWGIAALVVAAVGYWAPHVVFAGSVSQVRNLCSSPLGAIAQASSTATAHSCSTASTVTTLFVLLALAGAALTAWPLLALRHANRETR
jgi:hypothetical protein